jgi:hypothetical protein
MEDRPLVAVDVPLVGDERHKHWAKVVEFVDDSKASGWAYEGQFIAAGGIQDVPAGAVLLVYGERGSRGNPQSQAEVYIANADGTLTHQQTARGRAWARTVRDRVVELLAATQSDPLGDRPWDPVLMGYSVQALRDELARRGASDAS